MLEQWKRTIEGLLEAERGVSAGLSGAEGLAGAGLEGEIGFVVMVLVKKEVANSEFTTAETSRACPCIEPSKMLLS